MFPRLDQNENYLFNSSYPINCAFIGQEAGLEFCLIQCSFLASHVFPTFDFGSSHGMKIVLFQFYETSLNLDVLGNEPDLKHN